MFQTGNSTFFASIYVINCLISPTLTFPVLSVSIFVFMDLQLILATSSLFEWFDSNLAFAVVISVPALNKLFVSQWYI